MHQAKMLSLLMLIYRMSQFQNLNMYQNLLMKENADIIHMEFSQLREIKLLKVENLVYQN